MSKLMHNFRKYQKLVLAVTGVLIIFVFTVGDQIMGWLGARPDAETVRTSVVVYKGGRISEAEMQMMVAAHYRARVGCERVGRDGLAKAQMPSGYMVFPGYLWGIDPSDGEESVLQLRLLAEKARDIGLDIDDTAVYQFLRRLYGVPSTSTASDGDIRQAVEDELGEQMSFVQFVEQMKIELLAQNMRYLARSVLTSTDPQTLQPVPSPAEAYAYFERLNRESQIEAVPVNASDYLDEVKGNPTDKQLRDLYDEYKEQEPSPYYAEPGFRVPQKVAIQYVKVDFNKLLEEEKKKITEEQIKEEYEKGVASGRFNAASLPEEEPKTEEQPADEKKDDEKPTDEPAADEKKDDSKKEEPADAAAGEEKKDEPAADAAKADDAKSEGTCQEAEPPAGEKPAEEKKSDEPAADEKPATDNKPAEEKKDDTSADSAKPDADQAPPAEEGKPKVQPLEKVREQILRTLASQPAQERLTKAFNEIEKEVLAYRNKTQPDRSKARDEQDPQKKKELEEAIKPFDIAAAAKAQGLEYRVIALSTPVEVDEDEIGRAFSRAPTGLAPFVDSAFQPNKQPYVPEAVRAFLTGTEYLYWITQRQEGYTPEFADARKDVEQAWRTLEARKIAKEAAEKMAAEAKKDQSLKDIYGDKVIETGKFTWMRGPNTPSGAGGRPTLSEVTGIDQAGEQFMRVVFNLQVGEVGVAPNQSQNIFYVVRVVGRTPGDDLLREQFIGSRFGYQSVMPIASFERQQLERQWFQDLAKEFNVEWKREPRSNRG